MQLFDCCGLRYVGRSFHILKQLKWATDLSAARQVLSKRQHTAGGRAGTAGLAVLASTFFMWGFVTVLNDVLVPHLKSVFQLDYRQTLLIQFVFFGTYFLIALPSAKLIEWVGYKYAIVTGLLSTATGALIFLPAATVPSYPIFLLGLFVLGSGITVLQVAANPYEL
jgi:MFS transporter, FHS family, L-fucose permease